MVLKYIKLGIAILIIAAFISLIIGVIVLYNKTQRLQNEVSVATANERAFALENSDLKGEKRMFQFTIGQLEYFNDSLTTKLNNVRKELKIKNQDLKQMQYLLSEAKRVDTIKFVDTIFVENTEIDTVLQDDWYRLELGMRYPNLIVANPSFNSEKYIITSIKKETIKPPHKCKFIRFFQKKHKVLVVEVVEKSPYIENKQQRFIEIIK